MALSAANKAKVRRYLGYPDVNRRNFYELEGALVAVSAEAESIVTGLLTSLDTAHAALESAWSRQKVIRAEDVTLAGGDELRALRAEGRRLSGELASVLDVQILRNVWGGGNASSGVSLRG